MFKRLFFIIAILAIASTAYAYNPPGGDIRASAVLTGDGQAVIGAGYLYGIICANDGTNNWTLDLYDNTSAAGTKLIPSTVITTNADDRSSSIGFNPSVTFSIGVWFQTTTSDPSGCIVYYHLK